MEAEITSAFLRFAASDDYTSRLRQIAEFRPLAREVLRATVEKGEVSSTTLTGLIQLLKYRARNDRSVMQMRAIVERYLPHIASDPDLISRLLSLQVYGYTGVGKAVITQQLSPAARDAVMRLMRGAFDVTNVTDAQRLSVAYDTARVPEVTPGIYSSWLHYINPGIFPIISKKSDRFFPKRLPYSTHIRTAAALLDRLDVRDLGLVDSFSAISWSA